MAAEFSYTRPPPKAGATTVGRVGLILPREWLAVLT